MRAAVRLDRWACGVFAIPGLPWSITSPFLITEARHYGRKGDARLRTLHCRNNMEIPIHLLLTVWHWERQAAALAAAASHDMAKHLGPPIKMAGAETSQGKAHHGCCDNIDHIASVRIAMSRQPVQRGRTLQRCLLFRKRDLHEMRRGDLEVLQQIHG